MKINSIGINPVFKANYIETSRKYVSHDEDGKAFDFENAIGIIASDQMLAARDGKKLQAVENFKKYMQTAENKRFYRNELPHTMTIRLDDVVHERLLSTGEIEYDPCVVVSQKGKNGEKSFPILDITPATKTEKTFGKWLKKLKTTFND